MHVIDGSVMTPVERVDELTRIEIDRLRGHAGRYVERTPEENAREGRRAYPGKISRTALMCYPR